MKRKPRTESEIQHIENDYRSSARKRRRAEFSEDENWVQVKPERTYRDEKALYQQSLKERKYRKDPEEESYFREEDRYRERAYRKPVGQDRKPEPYQKPRKKKGAGRVIKVLFCFLLVLAIGLGVVWAVPPFRGPVAKALLKSPLGVPVGNLLIGGNYDKYVRDKDFDSSQIVIHPGVQVPKGNTTIALFGVDSTEEELANGTRSDSIMVINVDKNGNMRMASVFRDTYLLTRNRSGTEVITKANASYAFGGPTNAVNMLNENFDLGITDYMVVDFQGMANIIDVLGGLRLTVTEAEKDTLNDYLGWMGYFSGTEYSPLETYGDSVILTGPQVTAFCRIRSVSFYSPVDGVTYVNDYGRAARQRYVLTELLSQIREQGMFRLMTLANELFKANGTGTRFLQSSMTSSEMVRLFIKSSDMNLEGSAGFPDPEHQYSAYLDSGDTVVADTLEENAALMHQFLYGTQDFIPSEGLVDVADRIRAEVARQIG